VVCFNKKNSFRCFASSFSDCIDCYIVQSGARVVDDINVSLRLIIAFFCGQPASRNPFGGGDWGQIE
jgi:hypothetical protein